jgi:hypothetical protein
MRSLTLLLVLVFTASLAAAQLTVTSSTPADGATGVPTSTTLSVTFSAPIDTTKGFGEKLGVISNIDTITAQWYSTDRRTVYLNARFATNTVYFICIYWAPGDGGANFSIPQVLTFTTGSSFPTPGYAVSGTVSSGSTGIPPSYALIALSSSPIGDGEPSFIVGQVASVTGAFSFPGLPAGTYYPVAIRDFNEDGELDPSNGDPVAFGDPFTVVSAPISGLNLVFRSFGPLTYSIACDSAATVPASSIPADKVLRMMYSWDVDTTGLGSEWTFFYSSPSTGKYYSARIGSMDRRVEEIPDDRAQWFKNWKPIASHTTVALPESIIARTESAGGRTWRSFANTGGYIFKIDMVLGDLRNSQYTGMSFDTSKIYWGVEYQLGTQPRPDSFATVRTKRFVVDIVTGNIVSLTGVEEEAASTVPGGFALMQNYPNPFNPSTTIGFRVSGLGSRFVKLTVFDLLGREVAVLVNEKREPGDYSVTWNAGGITSGVYYYVLNAGDFFDVKKMLLVK